MIALAVVATGWGFYEGTDFVWRQVEPVRAMCVGGPLDGVEVPAPPFEGQMMLTVQEHPEGAYQFEHGVLVWTEHGE